MLSLKKSLLAVTVLTVFCANAAFAAEAVKPIERPLRLHCENYQDCPEYGHHRGMRGHRRGPQLTQEQIKERQERREAWRKMTPEQREEARGKWIAERREAAMSKLTAEQRAEVESFIKEQNEHREKMRARFDKMTDEQRDALRACGGYHRGYHRGYWAGSK